MNFTPRIVSVAYLLLQLRLTKNYIYLYFVRFTINEEKALRHSHWSAAAVRPKVHICKDEIGNFTVVF